MRITWSLFLLMSTLVLVLSLGSACGDDDGSGGDDNTDDDDDDGKTDRTFEQICASRETEEASDYAGECEPACEIIEACEGTGQACLEGCRLLTWEWNQDFAGAFRDCLGEDACVEGQMVNPCMEQAMQETAVSGDAESACSELATKAGDLCGAEVEDAAAFQDDVEAFCLSLGRMLTDKNFGNLSDCVSEDACDSFLDCLDTTSCVRPFSEG